jgi:2-C-methyl-D-erythritol 4-phosphate cytidylyltransferase
VVEYDGVQVYLSEGSYQNIKITTKEDLILAEAFIKNGY